MLSTLAEEKSIYFSKFPKDNADALGGSASEVHTYWILSKL